MLWRGWVDADVMNACLHATKKRFGRDYCILFMDGAGFHTGADLKLPAKMHIEFLPPYSPELNPAEGLWQHLHENYVGNHRFLTLLGDEGTLSRGLRDMAGAPDLLRSMTLFPWIKTAILTKK